MDNEMVEVIKQWESDSPVPLSVMEREDLAQRLHDAGYRKVPSIDKMVEVFHNAYFAEGRMNMGVEAIHDLMMGGK